MPRLDGGFELDERNMEVTATVYGTRNCSDCVIAKRTLDSLGVAYDWIDLGARPDVVPEVLALNGGNHSVPTVVLSDGAVFVEPSAAELQAAVEKARAAR